MEENTLRLRACYLFSQQDNLEPFYLRISLLSGKEGFVGERFITLLCGTGPLLQRTHGRECLKYTHFVVVDKIEYNTVFMGGMAC